MAFRVPANGFALPQDCLRPPVMAIGDSLYNGMRSATINAEFAAKSIPALVARVLAPDSPFAWPRYPESLLVNVEEALRHIHLFNFFRKFEDSIAFAVESAKRYFACDYRLPAGLYAWDNLAIAGAEVEHLTDWSYRQWDQAVAGIMPAFSQVRSADGLMQVSDRLMTLHMGLNARFLLNPGNERALDDLRPIDWVNLRKPRVLLISIGANHGIIDITLNGSESPQRRRPGNGLRSLRQWAETMTDFARRLVALPPETEEIYINTVPLPSTVPNLMYPYNPQAFMKAELRASEDEYFPVYENRLGNPDNYTQYTGAELRDIDREVEAINEAMIANVQRVFDQAGDARVRFFRIDQAFRRYNGKHVDALKVRERLPEINLEAGRRAYSNEAITFNDTLLWDGFREGGIGSLDNHHPSGLGYTIFARELLAFMRENGAAIPLEKAVISENGDRILTDPPDAYMNLIGILYKVRRHRAGLRLQPDRDEALGRRGAQHTPATPAAPPPLSEDERMAEPIGAYMNAILRPKA